MNKLITSICAAAVSMSVGGTSMAQTAATPFQALTSPAPVAPVIQIQGMDGHGGKPQWEPRYYGGRHFRERDRHYRGGRHFRGGHHYRSIPHYRGHRGYHRYRPGYRRHGNFWYPAAAFIAGAIISGAINNNRTIHRGGSAHIQWCYDRYRSYRATDNTFQPYHGSRRQCYSPYS